VLHRAHFKHGVKAEHYHLFNNAVIATMEASLGETWDEEQEEAWAALSSILMSVVNKAYASGTSAPHLLMT
jgi:hemoglobin-like flavoprotein